MRNWRLAEDTIISDGNIPNKRSLPGVISSMIMIKKIKYQYKDKLSNNGSEVLSLLGERPIVNVIKEIKSDFPKIDFNLGGIRGPDDGLFDPVPDLDLRQPRGAVEDISSLGLDNRRAIPTGNVDITGERNRVSVRDIISPGGINIISRPEILENNHSEIFHVEEVVNESETSEDYSFEDCVYVIAFVCQRIPKAPNPDLNLVW